MKAMSFRVGMTWWGAARWLTATALCSLGLVDVGPQAQEVPLVWRAEWTVIQPEDSASRMRAKAWEAMLESALVLQPPQRILGVPFQHIGSRITGRWKKAHPNTTVLVEALALGRDFDFRNNRDANGPIFPVGDVDPRLPIQEDIIGVIAESGTPVAFPRGKALLALSQGQEIAFENIRLELDAGGIRAVDANGSDLGSHQAFWFAWSQFHPGTALWEG